MIVSHLDIRIEARADAQTDIRTLIVHRVLGVDTHESTLGVLTIERTLRTAQDIHTVEHIEMIIESRLRHQGDVVVVNADSGTVDARTYTSDIHRGGKTRTVGRHREGRHVLRELREVAHVELLELFAAKDITAYRLEAEAHRLLGLCYHHHLV